MVAYDGETALHVLRCEHPHLVVLDLMLPHRDGWDVTRVIRGDPALAQTPIIILTAGVEPRDRIAGLELGADDCVTKPFHPGELIARIRAVLRCVQGGLTASNVIRAGGLLMDVDAHRVEVQGCEVHLTPTEFGLLQALAGRPGHAYPLGDDRMRPGVQPRRRGAPWTATSATCAASSTRRARRKASSRPGLASATA